MTFHRRYFTSILLVAVAVVLLTSQFALRHWNGYRCATLAKQCRLARNDDEWDKLQALATDWTSRDPQNGEAWLNRGIAATGQGSWAEAAEHFWQVPDSTPQAIPAMIELSKLSFTHLNQPLRGEAACERILAIDPLAAGARQQLIWFYAMTLQRAKLRQQILEAIRLEREPREAYVYYFLLYTLRSEEAVTLNTSWFEGSPNSELFLVARVINRPDLQTGSSETPNPSSANENRTDTAADDKLNQVAQLLTRFPHNLELIASHAEERFARGDFATAAEILQNAPESAAKDGRFWRFKGWLHEANGELLESIAAYRQALKLHPIDWNTMNRLAVVERRVHNQPEVRRLTDLIERGNETRRRLKTEKAVEVASPQILREMASLFRDCGDHEIATALEFRLTLVRRSKKGLLPSGICKPFGGNSQPIASPFVISVQSATPYVPPANGRVPTAAVRWSVVGDSQLQSPHTPSSTSQRMRCTAANTPCGAGRDQRAIGRRDFPGCETVSVDQTEILPLREPRF